LRGQGQAQHRACRQFAHIFILIGIREAHQGLVSLLLPSVFYYPVPHSKSKSHQHILFWGGLCGTLALALAFGLPSEIPRRDEIIPVAFGVIGFSVIVQGLTIPPPAQIQENLILIIGDKGVKILPMEIGTLLGRQVSRDKKCPRSRAPRCVRVCHLALGNRSLISF
jgi:hypothetical protein